MTRVCLVGSPEVNLQYELLSRETSREALATYDIERPFENTLSVRTVSVGAAVSLLNDLQWYLVRFVDEALVQEPSVSEDEWLSRDLAVDLRNGAVDPDETGEFLKIYGVDSPDVADEDGVNDGGEADADDPSAAPDETPADGDAPAATPIAGRLVEPLFVRRTDGEVPDYDLRDVDETLVVRLTESEFAP